MKPSLKRAGTLPLHMLGLASSHRRTRTLKPAQIKYGYYRVWVGWRSK